jgi:hypothetical protein
MLSQSAVRRKDYVISRFCCGFEADRWSGGQKQSGLQAFYFSGLSFWRNFRGLWPLYAT